MALKREGAFKNVRLIDWYLRHSSHCSRQKAEQNPVNVFEYDLIKLYITYEKIEAVE